MNVGISEVRVSVMKQVAAELLIKQLRAAPLIFEACEQRNPLRPV